MNDRSPSFTRANDPATCALQARTLLADPAAPLALVLEAATLAELAGEAELAMRAWQRVLTLDQDHTEAWRRLALLHEARGDIARADVCRVRAGQPAGPSPSREPESDPAVATDADRVRFAHVFAGRSGVHARMWHDPRRGTGYSPVRQGLSPDLVRAHLDGSLTLGTYLLEADGSTGLLVLDLDATKAALDHARGHADRVRSLAGAIHDEGLRMYRACRELGLDPLFEDSGYKGRHLWFLLAQPRPAAEVREAGRQLAAWLGVADRRLVVEVFPKQDGVAPGGLGNLVKLPLGIHLRTGRRCPVLDERGEPHLEPFTAIRTVARLGAADLTALCQLQASGPRLEVVSPPAAVPQPAPAVPEDTPPWCEADFRRSPQVGPVLDGCAVLARIVDDVLQRGHLTRGRALIAEHTLGHLPDGVQAVNYLLDKAGAPTDAKMGARHRGSPTSCRKVRQHARGLADEVPCRCVFPPAPGSYPNPLRHLDGQTSGRDAPSRTDLPELLEAYTRQLALLRRQESEADALRASVVTALERIPDQAWKVDGGMWRLDRTSGIPALVFEEDGCPSSR